MKEKYTRRSFLDIGLKLGISLPLLSTSLLSCKESTTEKVPKKMNILILGGTSFLGPHQVAYCLERGHQVSIFTRGKTQPRIHTELFSKVEHLIGDRADNLEALKNRKWSAVIDNSGHDPEWTRMSAELLKDNCDTYMYTSSTGVFYPYDGGQYTEEDEIVLSMPEGLTEEQEYEQAYGVMKGNSELEAIKVFTKDRTVIVRPTYMFGPGDKTDRFIHWPQRISQGGEVLVTGKVEDPVQYIDVRDVAEWMIRLLENKTIGTYNAVGPKEKTNMSEFVQQVKKAVNSNATFTFIDDYEFLKKEGINYTIPWIMPILDNHGSARISNQKAKRNGLTFRSFDDSIVETLDWWQSSAVDENRRKQYDAAPLALHNREKELLKKWKETKS